MCTIGKAKFPFACRGKALAPCTSTADDNNKRELRKHRYAAKYLWGIDFEARAAKTSRALMLIARDGHTNIFGPDVSSFDPRTWYESRSGQDLMRGLQKEKLTAKKVPEYEKLTDDDKAPKEERDVLFIERILKMLRPGGRAAIVLPQGKFNNSSLCERTELNAQDCLAIAKIYQSRRRPEDALTWVERGLAIASSDNRRSFGDHELHQMQRTLLAKIGRPGDALQSAWAEFEEYLSTFTYKELMCYVPAKEKKA